MAEPKFHKGDVVRVSPEPPADPFEATVRKEMPIKDRYAYFLVTAGNGFCCYDETRLELVTSAAAEPPAEKIRSTAEIMQEILKDLPKQGTAAATDAAKWAAEKEPAEDSEKRTAEEPAEEEASEEQMEEEPTEDGEEYEEDGEDGGFDEQSGGSIDISDMNDEELALLEEYIAFLRWRRKQ